MAGFHGPESVLCTLPSRQPPGLTPYLNNPFSGSHLPLDSHSIQGLHCLLSMCRLPGFPTPGEIMCRSPNLPRLPIVCQRGVRRVWRDYRPADRRRRGFSVSFNHRSQHQNPAPEMTLSVMVIAPSIIRTESSFILPSQRKLTSCTLQPRQPLSSALPS
jgi:hypothetical protein